MRPAHAVCLFFPSERKGNKYYCYCCCIRGFSGGRGAKRPRPDRRGRFRRPSANPFAALVYDLRSIGPEGLPWEEIRDLANAAGPHIRFRGSDRLDNRSKALVLTVAIAAVLVPELGPAWVLSAAPGLRRGGAQPPPVSSSIGWPASSNIAGLPRTVATR